jgi:hypothetical protein
MSKKRLRNHKENPGRFKKRLNDKSAADEK